MPIGSVILRRGENWSFRQELLKIDVLDFTLKISAMQLHRKINSGGDLHHNNGDRTGCAEWLCFSSLVTQQVLKKKTKQKNNSTQAD